MPGTLSITAVLDVPALHLFPRTLSTGKRQGSPWHRPLPVTQGGTLTGMKPRHPVVLMTVALTRQSGLGQSVALSPSLTMTLTLTLPEPGGNQSPRSMMSIPRGLLRVRVNARVAPRVETFTFFGTFDSESQLPYQYLDQALPQAQSLSVSAQPIPSNYSPEPGDYYHQRSCHNVQFCLHTLFVPCPY